MGVLGFDRSRWNAEPDFAAFRAAGGGFVICKATEGVGFADATFTACRTGTHAAGLVFGSYHFARWGDPVAEARYYLSVAAPQPGELVALDAEAAIPPGVDVVAWSLTFCRVVHDACGAWPLIYLNQSWLASHNWAPVAANDGLWLAKYDGVPTGGPTGPWPAIAMKQFTSTGSVPGESGQVDVDEFNGDLAALLRYAVPGTPAPAPTVQEDEMFFVQSPSRGTALGGPGYWKVLGSEEAQDVGFVLGRQASVCTDGGWDVIRACCVNGQVFSSGAAALDDARLFAMQGRDAATGANNRAGDILTAVNTQVIPSLGQAQAPLDPAAVTAAVHSWLDANKDTVIPALGAAIAGDLQLTPRTQPSSGAQPAAGA